MTAAEIAKLNLRRAMQLEIERALMDGDLDAERIGRVEAMLNAMKLFLFSAEQGSTTAELIQAERFRRLGFTAEQFDRLHHDPLRERQHQASVVSLQRAAEIFGVGDDSDDDEMEEPEEVPMTPVEVSLAVPLRLVRQTIFFLKGSDGDVAESLEELLKACNVTDETALDTVIAVETGHVVMACVGLSVLPGVPARDVADQLRGIIRENAIGWVPHVDRAVKQSLGGAAS